MERIETNVKREVVETRVTYKAIDGTVFRDKEQCEAYEESAAAALFAQLNDCVVVKEVDCALFEDDGENNYKTVIPTTNDHITTLNQLWFMYEGKGNMDTPKFESSDKGTPIVIGYRFYENKIDWIWFYKLCDEIQKVTDGHYKLVSSL